MTEFIKQLFLQNLSVSIKASVIIVLLLCLTRLVTKRYTAGWRYYSWLAVMIVFLIPFGKLGMDYKIDTTPIVVDFRNITRQASKWIDNHTSPYEVKHEVLVSRHSEEETAYYTAPKANVITYQKPIDYVLTLALIWLSIAIIYFIIHIKRYLLFKSAVKRCTIPCCDERITDVLTSEKERLKISANIPIRISSLADTPMLTGIMHPIILLADSEYSNDELHMIFRHELIHYKRKDIWYQFVMLIFLSLHWFNPIAYIMTKSVELDGETSCDEAVLKENTYDERIYYGEMLLGFLRTSKQKKSYLTTTFWGGKRGMKKRLTLIKSKTLRKKGTIAMAVLIALTIMSSVCAAAMSNEYFETIFEGDTSYLADFIHTEQKSVSDENYTFTLEQYLVAEKQAMVIFSFEANSEKAITELNAVDEKGHSTFWDLDTVGFGPVDLDKAGIGGCGTGSLSAKLDTERKKYFYLFSDSIDNKEQIDFYICTNKMTDTPKITFPMKSNIETKELVIGNSVVKYNPISISVNYPLINENDDCDFCVCNGTYYYFRMKNGVIKTYSELYRESSGSCNANYTETNAWARKIIKPDEIKSIIINDTEYPIDNPTQPTHVDIDNSLKPFKINAYVGDILWLPLREFCNHIGAEIKWDDATQSAEFEYRGSKYVFTVGAHSFFKDNEEISLYENSPFIDESGRMVVTATVAENMNINCHGCNAYDENDNLNPNALFHILP